MFPEIQLCEADASKYNMRLVLVSVFHGQDIHVSSLLYYGFRISQILNAFWTVDFDFEPKTSKLKQNQLKSERKIFINHRKI